MYVLYDTYITCNLQFINQTSASPVLCPLTTAWPGWRKCVQSDLCLERHLPVWVDWLLLNPLKESRTSGYVKMSLTIKNIWLLALLQTFYLPFYNELKPETLNQVLLGCRKSSLTRKPIKLFPKGLCDFGKTAEETWLAKLVNVITKNVTLSVLILHS